METRIEIQAKLINWCELERARLERQVTPDASANRVEVTRKRILILNGNIKDLKLLNSKCQGNRND